MLDALQEKLGTPIVKTLDLGVVQPRHTLGTEVPRELLLLAFMVIDEDGKVMSFDEMIEQIGGIEQLLETFDVSENVIRQTLLAQYVRYLLDDVLERCARPPIATPYHVKLALTEGAWDELYAMFAERAKEQLANQVFTLAGQTLHRYIISRITALMMEYAVGLLNAFPLADEAVTTEDGAEDKEDGQESFVPFAMLTGELGGIFIAPVYIQDE